MQYLFTTILSMLFTLCSIIGLWKTFEKCDESGWKAIVPLYNSYMLGKIVWGNGWYFLLSFIPLGGLVYNIVTYIKLGKAFDKSNRFILGLIFLSPIFLLLLGNDQSFYRGVNPCWKTRTIIGSILGGVVAILLFVVLLSAYLFVILFANSEANSIIID